MVLFLIYPNFNPAIENLIRKRTLTKVIKKQEKNTRSIASEIAMVSVMLITFCSGTIKYRMMSPCFVFYFSIFFNSCTNTTLSCLQQPEIFYQKWHPQINLSIGPISYSHNGKLLTIKGLNSSRHTIHVLPNKTLMPNSKAFRRAGIWLWQLSI